MNYVKQLISILCITTASTYCMHELNFAGTYQDQGSRKGRLAARALIGNKQNTNKLAPVIEELTTVVKNENEIPVISKQFEGFVSAYAKELARYNLRQSQESIMFTAQEIEQTLTAQNLNGLDKVQKKSRKELIAFLTATFTKAKLLSSD